MPRSRAQSHDRLKLRGVIRRAIFGRRLTTMTGGEAHDCPLAERLIRRVKPPKHLLGDKAYDSSELCCELDERETKPVSAPRGLHECKGPRFFEFNAIQWRIGARTPANCVEKVTRN